MPEGTRHEKAGMSRGAMIAISAVVTFGAAIAIYLAVRTAGRSAAWAGGELLGVFLGLWFMSWVPAWIVLAVMRGRTARGTLVLITVAALLLVSAIVWFDRMQ